MKVVDVRLETKDAIHIAGLGDIQYGNPGFSQAAFTRALDRLNGYSGGRSSLHVIGTGDYIDAMSPSNRERYRQSGLYSSTRRTLQVDALEPLVGALFKQIRHLPWTVLCRGHHWFDFDYEDIELEIVRQRLEIPDDAELPHDSDQYLGIKLGVPVAQSHALINFRFPDKRVFRVLAWHGEGNGQTLTYGLNKLVRRAAGWENLGAVFMGHTHKLGGISDTRLAFDDAKGDLVALNIPLVTCGAFLRGYLKDEVLYPEKGGMNALALGHPVLTVAPRGRSEWDIELSLHW